MICVKRIIWSFFVAVEQHVEQQSEVAYMQQLSVCEMLEAWYNGCMRQTLWLLMV